MIAVLLIMAMPPQAPAPIDTDLPPQAPACVSRPVTQKATDGGPDWRWSKEWNCWWRPAETPKAVPAVTYTVQPQPVMQMNVFDAAACVGGS